MVYSGGPDAGPLAGGTTVSIVGERLQNARSVTFGADDASDLKVVDAEHLNVVTPAHPAGQVSVVVDFADGGAFFIAEQFSYLKVPRLDALSPDMGATAGGQWISLTGDALSRADTQLRALSPSNLPGPVDVTATSPGGTSNPVRFVYLP